MASSAPNEPEALFLARSQDALDHWRETGDGVTSSITGGGAIAALERAFSDLLRGRSTIAMPSGTAALRVALETVGVKPGSEVICPVYDWPASVAAIRSLGAHPVFADVDPCTMTIDPKDAATRISPRTRAIVATHLFGVPADVTALGSEIHGTALPIVEDCAQAVGALIDGQPVGTLGDAAAFSFGPGKTIDAGEGGLVAFQTRPGYLNAVQASQHPVRQVIAGATHPRCDAFALRIHPLAAVLAYKGLADLPTRLAQQFERTRAVQHELGRYPGARALGVDERRVPNWHEVPFLLAPSGGKPADHFHLVHPGATLMRTLGRSTPRARAAAPFVYTASALVTCA